MWKTAVRWQEKKRACCGNESRRVSWIKQENADKGHLDPVYISYFLMFLYSAVNKDSVTNIQVSQETLSNVQAEAWSSGHCGWISSAPSAELTPSRVLGHAAHSSYVWRANSCNGPRQVQLFSCQWLAIQALNCSTSMEYSLLYLSN